MRITHSDGDFGENVELKEKRAYLKQALGDEVEDLIHQYRNLRWADGTIIDCHDRVDWLHPQERKALLVRLANELEEAFDSSISFWGDNKFEKYCRQITLHKERLVSMSSKLGYPMLAGYYSYVPEKAMSLPRRMLTDILRERSFCVSAISLSEKVSQGR